MILIAGPCVIESRDFILQMAEELREIASLPNVDFYFKSSFDKANRTSISSFRGPGLEKGCEILAEVKEKFGYMLRYDNFFKQYVNKNYMVDEDLHRFMELCENLKTIKQFDTCELRIKDTWENIIWCEISATGIRNNEGKLARVMGLLKDISKYKNSLDKLKKRQILII